MNKRNIIKIILCLISLIFIITFQISIKDFGFVYFIPVLFLTTIYMYKYKNEVKKYKFIYDVILMLLMFFSSILLIYMLFSFSSLDYIITESPMVLNLFNIYFILKILVDSIINLNKESNKINDYMTIIIFSIINLIYIRYYLEINIIITSEINKIEFINQNNIYFFIMLIVTQLHKYLSNKLK